MVLQTPYDLLIVDLMLPDLNGTELISKLRRNNTTVPILILTARDAVEDKVKNSEAGAEDSPSNISQLIRGAFSPERSSWSMYRIKALKGRLTLSMFTSDSSVPRSTGYLPKT
jgi:CheY-like chemotaxis protein